MAAASPGQPSPIVGLRREREVLAVALETGRHVVIEGPPGTGKSTLLRDIARQVGRDVVFVEGNAELTSARLIGQYDPSQVLAEGYVPASFSDGPLLRAMRAGALLYVEEFNRIPEETLNVLITVLTESEIAVPRLGTVRAAEGFRLVAAMNPFDAIGTARVSQAIADRICRIVLGYQDAPAERQITRMVTGTNGQVVDFAVTLTRATRQHRDVHMGSSVRGSIDLVLLLTGLARLRGETSLARLTARDAAYAALSGRIRIADGCDRTPESVLDELLAELWPADSPRPGLTDSPGGAGDGGGPSGRQGKADRLPPAAAGDFFQHPRSAWSPPGPRAKQRRAYRQPHRTGRHVPVLHGVPPPSASSMRRRSPGRWRPSRRRCDAPGGSEPRDRPGAAGRRAPAGGAGLLPAGPGSPAAVHGRPAARRRDRRRRPRPGTDHRPLVRAVAAGR